jgi:iron transport multicopper oxidase
MAGTSSANGTGVGIGIPTVTSFKGQNGTGIVWICDLANGLKAFRAVPNEGGLLERIPLPPTGPVNKFLRPAFGDGRVYVANTNGSVLCLGNQRQ